MIEVTSLAIPDVKLVAPKRHGDARGYFVESYNERTFQNAGIGPRFVQDNQSCSKPKGTIRGLHYQAPPHVQAKLVRVLKGAVLDVVVDARKASPTFGRWLSVRLDPESAQLFVPAGFLHGFATLEPDTEIAYKVDDFYDRDCDGAVLWNDPDLGVDWGIAPEAATISEKDAKAPRWRDFKSPF
ncbi:MAG: dTDP-4-dehydrorhamnose 3,5-epimerase [Amphiplicatus sp.]